MHKLPLHHYIPEVSKSYPAFLPSLNFRTSWITPAKAFQKQKPQETAGADNLSSGSWGLQSCEWLRKGQCNPGCSGAAAVPSPCRCHPHPGSHSTHPSLLTKKRSSKAVGTCKQQLKVCKKWKHYLWVKYLKWKHKTFCLFKYWEISLQWSANLCLDFWILKLLSNAIHSYLLLLLILAFLISLHLEAPALPIPLTTLIALSLKSMGLCKLPL